MERASSSAATQDGAKPTTRNPESWAAATRAAARLDGAIDLEGDAPAGARRLEPLLRLALDAGKRTRPTAEAGWATVERAMQCGLL